MLCATRSSAFRFDLAVSMSGFAFSPAAQASVAIANSDKRFPVRRIYCVGRNYAEHVREMGNDPEKSVPFFFGKPADALVESGASIPYPVGTSNLHHEIELVVAIGEGGVEISQENALGHVWGYAVGIDLTRRDVQAAAKAAGRPWDMAKGFDNSAPIAAISPVADCGHLSKGRIWLAVDGEIRQESDIALMIWSVPEIISALSAQISLRPGDLIMTGTPQGVGPILRGQSITGGIDRLLNINVNITAP